MKRWTASLLGLLLGLAVSLSLLTLVLDGLGGSGSLMQSMMTQHAPPEVTGLPADDYPPVARMIAGYLSGRTDTFQYMLVDAAGDETPVFHPYEQAHMADCRSLFVLERALMLASVLIACLTAGALVWLRAWKRQAAIGFTVGIGLVMTAALVLIVWGMADFDSLFVLFHHLSFSNDLWLLDPSTDMLIRLMPTSFFLHYAAMLGGTWLVGMLILGGIGVCCIRRWGRRKQP